MAAGDISGSGELLRSYFSFEQALPNRQRLIVMDLWDSHGVKCFAVLVLIAREPIHGQVQMTGQPNAPDTAWLFDPDRIDTRSYDGIWRDRLRRFCLTFATKPDSKRIQSVGATKLKGVVDFGNKRQKIPEDYDIEVTLRSEAPGPSVEGEYKYYTIFHPEYPFIALAGTAYYSTTGKLPI